MSHVISVIGGDSQVGTTMTVQSMGEALAKEGESVLVIMASGKPGDPYFQNPRDLSIDGLRASLSSGVISPQELAQSLVENKGIRILPGVRSIFVGEYYPYHAIQTIIQAAGEFHYILLDCGSDCDRGLAISAMIQPGMRFFLLTQQEKTLARMRYLSRSVFQELAIDGKLILNKYQISPALPGVHEIEQMFSMKCAGTIPYIEYGWQAEMRKETLYSIRRYRRSIQDVLRRELGESKQRKPWKNGIILKSI